MTCPICAKRKPERFCPAKGEKICAVCCAKEREVTIDCPADCAYLVAAHRYEDEHRKPVATADVPFPDVRFSPDLIHEHRPALSGLGYAILQFAAAEPSLADADALAAIAALAETYRTLGSGIYYEKPPSAAPAKALYAAVAKFIQDAKQQDSQTPILTGIPVSPRQSEQMSGHRDPGRRTATGITDTEVFHLLVFLLRVGHARTNGRPRARGFLHFLRAQFPKAATAPEPPRIIVP